MALRMRDERFRKEQERDRYAPHVREINMLIDELRGWGRGWMPHIAPLHGGSDARILSVLRDPGKKTQDGSGSGFLCIENDDETAKQQCERFAAVGITAADVIPWNAYPWYIDAKPKASQIEAAVEPTLRLIKLLPRLRIVLLQGNEAKDLWKRLLKRRSSIERTLDLTVIPTFHPGNQALWTADSEGKAMRIQNRIAAYRYAAELLSQHV